ncbi:alpha/beta hydrolase [Pleionea sediminis]|uniref:alpha/beta hydrolase n=1 Tax=Pleionea sediminis TaxID=2569479 RepID=UPI0013DDF0EB|nr:alpha/beta fold hydrolase [Pleionea sediminis]
MLNIEYSDIFIPTTDKNLLHGWHLKTKEPSIGTIIFLHGNAENISTHIRSVYWLVKFGYQIVIIDYQGYGRSTGTASLEGALNDVVNTVDFTLNKIRNKKNVPTYILGQSLGASLAITALTHSEHLMEKIDGYILEAPFANFRQITRDALGKNWLTWPLQYPLSWTITNNYNPEDTIHKLRDRPVLFIYSEEDQIIPFHHYKQLNKKLNSQKSYLLKTHDKHIRSLLYKAYREKLLYFLKHQSLSDD